MFASLLLFLLLLFASPVLPQEGEAGKLSFRRNHPLEDYDEGVLDSLQELYGHKKEIPAAYRRSILIALSAYPELKEVPIRFREDAIRTTMLARPFLVSLLGDQRERRYKVLIDTLDPASEGKLFEELSLEARIGILAHELAHILDYEERGVGELILFGLRYAFPEERRRIEAKTDRRAVSRGFGWQLLAFKEQLDYCAELVPSYRAYKREIYLSCGDLVEILEKDPDYSIENVEP